MLYPLREVQRAFLEPVSAWAEGLSKLTSAPYSPWSYLPFARRASAGWELLHRLGKTYGKPSFDLPGTVVRHDGEAYEVPVVERVVIEKPFCTLVRFERALPPSLADRPADPKVLIVAPLSGHFATLLRDTVRAMLPEHDVYVTDWIDAREVPVDEGRFGLDEYVAYVVEFLRALGPDVHVLAVCQPTVPVLGAVSLMSTLDDPRVPRSITLMGGPIDPRQSPTKVNELATTRPLSWFADNLIHRVPHNHPGAGRRVYPGFLQLTGFVAMNPDRHFKSYRDYYVDLVRGAREGAAAHRAFYDEYNAVLDMDADYYLETIATVFQAFALPKGTWRVRFEGREVRVAPEDIRVPRLLTVEGELDDITGAGQTSAALALCRGIPAERKRHHTAQGAGHYGIFSGRRWRESICPLVRDFIRES